MVPIAVGDAQEVQPCYRKYVTGGGPREFKGLDHFRFALCLLLEIEDVSSQFLALAAMPVSYRGLPALVDFSLFGNISQMPFLPQVAPDRPMLPQQLKSS